MRPDYSHSGNTGRGTVARASEFAHVSDSARRARNLTVGFAICLAIVLSRIVWLEMAHGTATRKIAAQPLQKSHPLPAMRGRILSRDGVVLAADARVASLAVHYRYLEDPPNARWLRGQARARVAADAPDRAARLAEEQNWLAAYHDQLLENLARLCGRPVENLAEESRRIRSRVRAISAVVNQSREQAATTAVAKDSAIGATLWNHSLAAFPDWLVAPDERAAPPHIVVAEELEYHVLVPDVPLEVVAHVESHPAAYPGVRIVEQSRRVYPQASLAGNVVGFVGTSPNAIPRDKGTKNDPPVGATVLEGRQGVEHQFEATLRGRNGLLVDATDHSGRLLSSARQVEPVGGLDLVLTIDSRAQQAAEDQLDRALVERLDGAPKDPAAGGAIVVLDITTGDALALATVPRFDPNIFVDGDTATIHRLLQDPSHPMFDRTMKMAIPPGSVFKIVTALALLDSEDFSPAAMCDCQGYLSRPDRQRCQVFRRYGTGHGPVTLADALARSCNVYFFQHAEQVGAASLESWGRRLGFGQPTGIDLPGEAGGTISPSTPHGAGRRSLADTQALAIGQSTLTATPLQVARLMAAVANGGRLVTPHVLARPNAEPVDANSPLGDVRPAAHFGTVSAHAETVQGINDEKLALVRRAMRAVVDDPEGTAYSALADAGIAVAGKTGTAETGPQTADHAWFAGYAPADHPRIAFAVVLEHQGSADRAATLTKELLRSLEALGLLAPPGF